MSYADTQKPKTQGERFALCIDVASKIVGMIAIIVGGWWALTQFTVRRENAHILLISVTPRLTAMDTDSPLIIADVSLNNVGKVPIWPGQHTGTSLGEGCELTVIEYDDHSKGKSLQEQIIDWDECGGGFKYIVKKYNLLGTLVSFQNENYMLNPGVEYHETGAVPVTKGKLYGIRVRFFSDEGWTTADFNYVYVPLAKDD